MDAIEVEGVTESRGNRSRLAVKNSPHDSCALFISTRERFPPAPVTTVVGFGALANVHLYTSEEFRGFASGPTSVDQTSQCVGPPVNNGGDSRCHLGHTEIFLINETYL